MRSGELELEYGQQTTHALQANNPLKLAEAIDYLLGNMDVRIKMGQAAGSRITENFALEVLVKKLCEIYEKVVNN